MKPAGTLPLLSRMGSLYMYMVPGPPGSALGPAAPPSPRIVPVNEKLQYHHYLHE